MYYQLFDVKKRYDSKWSIITLCIGIMYALFMLILYNYLSIGLATLILLAILISCFPMLTGNVKYFFIGVLIFTLPLNIDKSFLHTFNASGADGLLISLYDITLAFLYLLWFSEIIRKKNVPLYFFSTISIPAICLIIVAFFSLLHAPHKNLSIFEITEIVKMYLGFFYLAHNLKSERDVRFAIGCLLLGLLLEGVLGIAQLKTGESLLPGGMGFRSKMVGYKSEFRISGTWISYNDFAWYLTFIIPIAISILFSKIKTLYKLFSGIILLFGMGALLGTLSRAGYLSITIAMLIIVLLTFQKIKGKTSFSNFFGSVIFFMIIIIVFSAMNPGTLKTAKNRTFVDDDNGSAESRIPQIKVAYSIIKTHPFSGIGINNYTQVVGQYDTMNELKEITHNAVHNIFLHIAAEMGTLGLAIFLWLLSAIFVEGLHCIKLNDGLMANIVIGMLAGITAFLIHGLVDTSSIGNKLFLFLWVFAGIILAIKNLERNKRYNLQLII